MVLQKVLEDHMERPVGLHNVDRSEGAKLQGFLLIHLLSALSEVGSCGLIEVEVG